MAMMSSVDKPEILPSDMYVQAESVGSHRLMYYYSWLEIYDRPAKVKHATQQQQAFYQALKQLIRQCIVPKIRSRFTPNREI